MTMFTRRSVLSAAAALGAVSVGPGWASAGGPAHLAAARARSGAYELLGLDAAGEVIFAIPLPNRGHAAARRPSAPHAVAFARRPGRFALVIDCAAGREIHRLAAAEGRRFYGHGVFSADGAMLYTTENDFSAGRGVIGIWDARDGYKRIGEVASGGVGPHEVALAPDGELLVIANGGIETHPDAGRAKLNVPTMRPNLAYLRRSDGVLLETVEPPARLRLNSVRHLSVRADGLVAAALQWQGAPLETPPLIALHRRGQDAFEFVDLPLKLARRTRNYAGSVSFSGDGAFVSYTAPRGGFAPIFRASDHALMQVVASPDICGAAPHLDGLRFTSGAGAIIDAAGERSPAPIASLNIAFDNHLIAL